MLYQLSYAPKVRRLLFTPGAQSPSGGEQFCALANRKTYAPGPTHERRDGDVAQLVERLLCKQDVAGSIPVVSTKSRRAT